MLILLVFICFCLTTISHAEIIMNSANSISSLDKLSPSSSPFDMENELEKISSTCFTRRDYELLTGDILQYVNAVPWHHRFLEPSSMSIGRTELRRTLNFSPIRPWKPYNETRPSEEELASAPSIEAYYNLIEPIPYSLSLDNEYVFEKSIVPTIAYLDKRLPSIRTIYRHRFEEMHQLNNGLIDRKSIKRMIDELDKISNKIGDATEKMFHLHLSCTRTWNN